MKLRDHFKQLWAEHLDDIAKLRVYEAVLKKQAPRHHRLLGRFSPAAKVAIFSFFVVLMIFGQFQAQLLYAPGDGNTNVSANQVGRIINAHGGFFILKDGKKVTSDTIKDGDTIVLGYNSEMIFQINNSTTAKIVGPAELVINDVGENNGVKNYVLNLLDGTFFEMNSAATGNTNVVLKTNNTDIQSANLSQQTHFTITESNGKKVINNKGSELLVQKTLKQKKVTTTIKYNQVATLSSPQEEVNTIAQNLKNKEISKTFDLGEEATTLLTTSSKISSTGWDQSGAVTTVLKDAKKVLSIKQLEQVKQYLGSAFVISELEQIALHYLNGSKADYEAAIQIFLVRVDQTSEALGLRSVPQSPASIATLISALTSLNTQIDQTYYTSPSVQSSLKLLVSRVGMIQAKEFGSYTGNDLTTAKALSIVGVSNTSRFILK